MQYGSSVAVLNNSVAKSGIILCVSYTNLFAGENTGNGNSQKSCVSGHSGSVVSRLSAAKVGFSRSKTALYAFLNIHPLYLDCYLYVSSFVRNIPDTVQIQSRYIGDI